MSPCQNCPVRAACTAPCPLLESLLPPPDAGRDHLFEGKDARTRVALLVKNMDAARVMVGLRDVLTPAQRKVFDLYYNHCLTQYEIADLLGLKRQNVGTHLARGRGRIRRELARRTRLMMRQRALLGGLDE
jgi:DNA-directed RNA polymerase specialized sigma24 family protein